MPISKHERLQRVTTKSMTRLKNGSVNKKMTMNLRKENDRKMRSKSKEGEDKLPK